MRSGSLAVMVLATMGIAVSPAIARAQESALGYAFAGPTAIGGDRPLSWTVGGGGEMITGWKGTTVGLDVTGLWSLPPTADGRYGRTITSRLFSANVSRHFYNGGTLGKWQPYVTGGIFVIASGDDGGAGLMAGGGVDRWFTPHAGLRIDARDQFSPGLLSLVGVRVGIVFR